MHLRSNIFSSKPLRRQFAPVWMFLGLAAALLSAPPARAQNSPPTPAPGNPARAAEPGENNPEDVPVFSSDTRLVLLPVTVVDKNGKLLTTIPQSAFKVYENGIEQPLKIFRR